MSFILSATLLYIRGIKMKHTFKFSLFSKRVRKFREGQMGVVIEKEADVVCVYGTNNTNTKILCAVPLCHPKYLRGERYTVNFTKDGRAKISVKDIKIIIDFKNQTCSNNSGIHCYGSESWGNNVEVSYCED